MSDGPATVGAAYNVKTIFHIKHMCAAEDERVHGNHPDPGSWNLEG